jgi:hypothetical protein
MNVLADSSTEVKIILRWDGHRPKINLLEEFHTYLVRVL